MSTTTAPNGGKVVRFKAATETSTKFKFTRERIEKAMRPLARLGRPFFLRDTEIPGLCLRWQSDTARTFILEKRHNHRLWRVHLGDYTANVDLEAIRSAARDTLHKIHTGKLEAEEQARRAAKSAGVEALRYMSIKDAVEAHITKAGLRQGSAEGYRIAARRVGGANPVALRDRPLSLWTAEDVGAAFDSLTTEVSAQTVTGYMRSLNAVVESWRARWPEELRPRDNPIALGTQDGRKSKKVTAPPRTRSLKAKETASFITTAGIIAAASKPSRAGVYRLLQLLALTGMRFEELAALRWAEVDLQDAALRLGADRMKAKKPFDKPLGAAAVAVLKAQREASGGGQYVFPSPVRPEVHIDDARTAIAKVCKDAGTTRITPHDLRRTYQRAAEAARLPHSRIKALVHHSHGKDVTLGYIGDGFDDTPHDDAQKVEDFLLTART